MNIEWTNNAAHGKIFNKLFLRIREGGLEPPRLSAYAPQAYVSAIPPPAQKRNDPVSKTGLLCKRNVGEK